MTHSRDGEVVHGVLPLGKETARRHGGRDGSGQQRAQRAQRAQRNSDRLHGHTSRVQCQLHLSCCREQDLP